MADTSLFGLGQNAGMQFNDYGGQQVRTDDPYMQQLSAGAKRMNMTPQQYDKFLNPATYGARWDSSGNPINSSTQIPTGVPQPTSNSMAPVPNLPNGIPDYHNIANAQSKYNLTNAQMQSNLNNPNYKGPGGAQTRTQNADGTYSVTQTLSPTLQKNYDASNELQGSLISQAQNLAKTPLSYDSAGDKATFDTSGVRGIPQSDARDLDKMRDSVYAQQTQYLDPQFKQTEDDTRNRLANQGIMQGSEAYDREFNNLAMQKQKAYGDARNSAIQAGGQEQSRLFGLGMQSHTTGMNDALAGFNTGMQGRQQGVSEANALHNSPINDIAALRNSTQVQLPTYPGQVGTSIPGVDYMNAANMGFNADLNLKNAEAAKQTGFNNGLFGLGAAALQSPGMLGNIGSGLKYIGNGASNLFGFGDSNPTVNSDYITY